MKKKIIYITGGARSGKSTLAVKIAQETGKQVEFVATCEPNDKEMKRRVKKHVESRPGEWNTLVETKDLSKILPKINKRTEVVIIDCLTLYVSNLICSGKDEKQIIENIQKLLKALPGYCFTMIFVSNEVGSGIVPMNKLAREFRDIAGKVNQMVAGSSDEAYYMVSGLKIKLK